MDWEYTFMSMWPAVDSSELKRNQEAKGNPCLMDGMLQRTNKIKSSITMTAQVEALDWGKWISVM